MSIIKYNYDIDKNKYVGEHFQVKEFASFGNGILYTNDVLIDTNLVDYLERIFYKVHASKAIISSGYRNSACDKAVGGSGVGQHVNGRAADVCYYDENGYIIPSKIIVCIAFDIGIPGTATIDTNYSHLDTRTTGVYRGNESIGYSNYWTDPYSYFGVSKEDVRRYTKEVVPQKSIDELAQEVISGIYGNGEDRKKALGDRYDEVQARVNELLKPKHDYLSNTSYTGVSIVDALNEIGIDSSYNYRTQLAEVNGINNYHGSAEQNTELLNKLKNGNLIKA